MLKKFYNHTIAFFSISLLVLFMTAFEGRADTAGLTLDNFHQVSNDIYRSSQPNKSEMLQLEQYGIKSIINLRTVHSDRDAIDGTTLKSYWIRMRAGKITDDKIISVLKLIQSAPKPLLIHCWHGSDRTGVIIAMYRIIFQNWSKQAAINELLQTKYGYHRNYYPNIIDYLQHVDIAYIKQHVF